MDRLMVGWIFFTLSCNKYRLDLDDIQFMTGTQIDYYLNKFSHYKYNRSEIVIYSVSFPTPGTARGLAASVVILSPGATNPQALHGDVEPELRQHHGAVRPQHGRQLHWQPHSECQSY